MSVWNTLSDVVWAHLRENSWSFRAGRGQEAGGSSSPAGSSLGFRFFPGPSGLCGSRLHPLSGLQLGPIWLSRFDLSCLASVCAESGSV